MGLGERLGLFSHAVSSNWVRGNLQRRRHCTVQLVSLHRAALAITTGRRRQVSFAARPSGER